MQFDIRSFLESGRKPFEAHFEADFSKADFGGYSVNNPAVCDFTATLTEDGAAMLLCVRAHIDAECARCLEPLTRDYDFTREYFVRDRDLEDPDFELPCNENGCLDLEELAYQELIFEVPAVLLCSADCQGLCPICGKKKAAGCSCQPADNAAPADARLSILKQLLSSISPRRCPIMAIVPKRKHSQARRDKRRSNVWKLEAPTLVKCPQCGELKVPHKVCGKCGYYKGQEVIKKEA